MRPLVLWSFFRRTRFKIGELAMADAIVRLYPDNVRARLHSADSYVAHGQRRRAIEELDYITSSMKLAEPRELAQVRAYCRRLGYAEPLQRLLARNEKLPGTEASAIELDLADIRAQP